MKQLFLIFIVIVTAFSLEAKQRSGSYSNPDLDELRIEIEDLKQALHTTQIDLNLLDEKNKKHESSLSRQGKETSSASSLSMQVSSLEKKVASLEKTLEKITTDLRTLNTTLTQTTILVHQFENQLLVQDDRLNEVSKLKGTLASIAKAVGERGPPTASSDSTTYRVKAGDSLDKIARIHNTSAESIRKANNLKNDKILVGQELRIGNALP